MFGLIDSARDYTMAADRRGLLRGVVDTDSSSTFYADTIDTSREGLAWLGEPGVMWEAAAEDAKDKGVPVEEYLANIDANIEKFAESDTIYDRKELLRALRDAFTKKGLFVLLLGGKSVGKSYVLQTLKNQHNSANALAALVLYVDGRRTARDLGAGLATEIAKLSLEGKGDDSEVDWPKLKKAFRGVADAAIQDSFAKAGSTASATIQEAIGHFHDSG
jgi:hypothetical protein